jgi:hypothetical protein
MYKTKPRFPCEMPSDMATMHMAKGLAQGLVYHAKLLKAHPQTLLAGKATCCAMHAHLDAPGSVGGLA